MRLNEKPSERTLADPGEIARRGQEIYDHSYRAEYERLHMGEYAVIEIESRAAYVADSALEAIRAARRHHAQGIFHLIWVGHPGAFRVSYSSDAAAPGL